jgi:hypothetical protein
MTAGGGCDLPVLPALPWFRDQPSTPSLRPTRAGEGPMVWFIFVSLFSDLLTTTTCQHLSLQLPQVIIAKHVT